jgi:hypothetical protein
MDFEEQVGSHDELEDGLETSSETLTSESQKASSASEPNDATTEDN